MKNQSLRVSIFHCALASLLLSAPLARAADSPPADPKDECNKVISDASAAYTSMQSKPETAIPNWVVQQAKGVIILVRWSGAVGIGGTAGSGIGLKKNADGAFSAPAFYSVGGASLGLQVGGGKTETVAFLMSDKALNTLTDSKFVWSGNVKAVAGDHSSQSSTVNNTADVILYQQSSGLDVGAVVAGTQVSVANEHNRKFYENATITPQEIFAGKVKTPDSAKNLTDALDKQAK